jgi:hypothetical protein
MPQKTAKEFKVRDVTLLNIAAISRNQVMCLDTKILNRFVNRIKIDSCFQT